MKNMKFALKTTIFMIILSFGVSVAMVAIFGKLAPVGLITYRLVSHIVRPFFS